MQGEKEGEERRGQEEEETIQRRRRMREKEEGLPSSSHSSFAPPLPCCPSSSDYSPMVSPYPLTSHHPPQHQSLFLQAGLASDQGDKHHLLLKRSSLLSSGASPPSKQDGQIKMMREKDRAPSSSDSPEQQRDDRVSSTQPEKRLLTLQHEAEEEERRYLEMLYRQQHEQSQKFSRPMKQGEREREDERVTNAFSKSSSSASSFTPSYVHSPEPPCTAAALPQTQSTHFFPPSYSSSSSLLPLSDSSRQREGEQLYHLTTTTTTASHPSHPLQLSSSSSSYLPVQRGEPGVGPLHYQQEEGQSQFSSDPSRNLVNYLQENSLSTSLLPLHGSSSSLRKEEGGRQGEDSSRCLVPMAPSSSTGFDPKLFRRSMDALTRFDFSSAFEEHKEFLFKTLLANPGVIQQEKEKAGRKEIIYHTGHRRLVYGSGLQKFQASNACQYVLFVNGDLRITTPDQSQIYHFAEQNILQYTLPDGTKFNRFADGQREVQYPDGHIQILFANGVTKEIFLNKAEEITFPDGNKQLKSPPADSSQEPQAV
ncbi:t-complex protein 10 c-terminus protein [Cystoisospora suis]|uniref:T-complex protein 10 c-terminus protein n=1 Tax=Cystoisospora suis TaxID=483139 RepID=A0A2C6KXX8_9APIC|nr:t-complex protein 10 c-terminus protein [Cystoisospora suis]